MRHTGEGVIGLSQIDHDTRKAAAGNDVEALSRASARFYFSSIAGLLGRDWVESQAELLEFITQGREADAASSAREHIIHTGQAVSRLRDGVSPGN